MTSTRDDECEYRKNAVGAGEWLIVQQRAKQQHQYDDRGVQQLFDQREDGKLTRASAYPVADVRARSADATCRDAASFDLP